MVTPDTPNVKGLADQNKLIVYGIRVLMAPATIV
jgi:hypothetical protein